MAKKILKDRISTIQEIKKKNRLLNSIVAFVIITLLAVIIRYLYQPVSSVLDFLPSISITLIIGIVFFLAVIGLYLSVMLSRQTVRIIEDYSSRLEKILNITSDLSKEVYGDILLDKILDSALSITRSDAGSILMLDDKDNLTFKLARGEKASKLVGTSVEKGKGIAGWVAEKGLPLCISNVSNDKRFNLHIDAMDAMTGFETGSVLCVPLKTDAGIVGVLELLNKKGGHSYRQRDEEVITYLAEQAALSIIKTKFYEDQKNYQIHLTEILIEALDFHIPEMTGHARRVARYSNIIAKAMNMSDEKKKRLYFACLLHDVGFLKIKAENKSRKEEFMRHPVIGYEMMRPINFYADISPFILHHHERYDGFGYPSKLSRKEIPLEARIITIADAFDTMTSKTSYRAPISFDRAKEELKNNAGTQFDPELVEIFAKKVAPEHIVE